MKYRKLGSTGLLVSEIGYGTWGLGGNSYGHIDDGVSVNALNVAFENGVNFFDTADLYGDGHSEEIIALALHDHRNDIKIATKGGTLPHKGFYMPQDFSYKYLVNALHGSLKRLKTDHVDLYQLHSPCLEDIEKYEVIRSLEKFKAEGKILHYGISVRSPFDAVVAVEKFHFPVVQVNYNMIDQRASEINLFKKAAEFNTGLIIRTPLVFGYLTGSLNGNEKFQGSDHRSNWPREQILRWANAPKLFENINHGKKRTLVQLALQFCLYESSVSTVIPGMMNENEVLENLNSLVIDDQLSSDEISLIKSIYTKNEFYDRKAKES